MTPEQIAQAKLDNENKIKAEQLNTNNASPEGDESEEGGNPEGNNKTVTNQDVEEDVVTTPSGEEEEQQTTDTQEEVPTTTPNETAENAMTLEDALNKIKTLENEVESKNILLKEKDDMLNKPAINTSLSISGTSDNATEEKKNVASQDEIQTAFLKNMWKTK
jgi:hypothetical protein